MSLRRIPLSLAGLQGGAGCPCGRSAGRVRWPPSNSLGGAVAGGVRKPQRPARVLRALGVGVWGAGGGVLSHRISPAVPSALRGLTAVFGMGTGVALSLSHQPRVLGEGVRGCRVRWALGLGGLGHSLVVRSRGGDGAPAVSSSGGEEGAPVKPHGQLVRLGSRLTPLAPAAYRRGSLPRPFRLLTQRECSSWGGLPT